MRASVVLPEPGGPKRTSDGRGRPRSPCGGPGPADHVLLADQLVQCLRPQPPRERRDLVETPPGRLLEKGRPWGEYAPGAVRQARDDEAVEPSGADPHRHVEPARDETARRSSAELPRGSGRRVRAVREGAGASEPRRAASRRRRTAPVGWRCSRTRTSCPPTRASGAPTRSAASCATASSGAAARST